MSIETYTEGTSSEKIGNKNTCRNSLLLDVFDTVVKSLIIIFIILTFAFKVCTVVGSSMENTLYGGEKLLISNLLYTPRENDVIVFHKTGTLNEPVVKRVIAVGEKYVKIDYDNCVLYVSDDPVFEEREIVDESSYAYFSNGGYIKFTGTAVYHVPQGYLFVLGDNRNGSLDSRSDEVGLIDERTVLGKVIFRISPIDKFGTVN